MMRKSYIALAAALALPALPALGYEEAFAAPGAPDPKPTSVQVAGRYSEGYVLEEAAPKQPQAVAAVSGGYTEEFAASGTPAGAASAETRPAPAKVAAKQ